MFLSVLRVLVIRGKFSFSFSTSYVYNLIIYTGDFCLSVNFSFIASETKGLELAGLASLLPIHHRDQGFYLFYLLPYFWDITPLPQM